MQVAIRIDDITSDMDWESFSKFKAMLDKYQIKPLIGVVPDNQDDHLKCGATKEDFWQYLLQLQKEGFSIAQHGYRHLYTTKKGGIFPLNHFSEFAGLPYEVQRTMLQAGKTILEEHGIITDIFMAPAHSYDKNTLKALHSLGFAYVTDGFAQTSYEREQLTFLPIAYKRSNCFQEKEGITTLVYHINGMKPEQLAQYEKELEKVAGMPPYSSLLIPAKQKQTWFRKGKEKSLAILKHTMVQLIKGR